MKILWSPKALKDLHQIVTLISKDKKKTSLQWAHGVYKKVSRLKHFPHSGRIVPEVGRSDIREVIVGSYRIIYKAGSIVSILTVFHGAKTLKEIEYQ